MDRSAVSRGLLSVADALDARGDAAASGFLRRTARAVLFDTFDRPDDGCARCGGLIDQPPTGRRRKFCGDCAPVRRKPAQTAESQV